MLGALFASACCLSVRAEVPLPARLPPPLAEQDDRHDVVLVYFVPSDRAPTARHAEKIGAVMSVVADVYATDLRAHGVATAGFDFQFPSGSAVAPIVHLVAGAHPAAHYTGAPAYDGLRQWETVLPEVESALGPANGVLYVVFAETYDEGPAEYEWPGGVALGARRSADGGVGLFSAWILRDEVCGTTIEEEVAFLDDPTPIPGRTANDGRVPDSPRSELVEDGVGAVAHELGHALGLPHDLRDDPACIMGNAFRRLGACYWPARGAAVGFSPESALLLEHSRFLAADPDTTDDEPPVVEVALTDGVRPRLRIRASDDRALGVVVVADETGEVHVFGERLDGRRWRRALVLPVDPAGLGRRFTAIVTDRGGNLATVTVTSGPAGVPPGGGGRGVASPRSATR